MTDWRFAIDLVVPQSEYGWLNPDSKNNSGGSYDAIDWRDKRDKPPNA